MATRFIKAVCGEGEVEGINYFELLFTTGIPENLRFTSFTIWHALMLLAVLAGIIAVVARAKKTGGAANAANDKILAFFTWALPCIYIVRFTVFLLLDLYVEPQMSLLDRLPFHLCALNAIVMPLGVFTKNKTLLNYMYAISLPGTVAAMLTPAMSYYGRYYYLSWQVTFFYLDHGIMALVPILAIACGRFRPSVKHLPGVMMIFLPYTAAVYIANKILDENWLFLNNPDEGTVMALFARYLGNPGYIAGLAALTAVIVFFMYMPWVIADKKANVRRSSP